MSSSAAESVSSVLYLLAFMSSFLGGGAVVGVLALLLGDKLLDNFAAVTCGFMFGAGGAMVASVYGIRRFKARAEGRRFEGGVVHAPTPSPLATGSRKELVWFGVGLLAFGAFAIYYFGDLESPGGAREVRMNMILYGLYMFLGRWGVAAVFWVAGFASLWSGLRRR